MTMTAILMPLIMGFAGLGLDLTNWYMQKRVLQSLVDAGAIMGAHSVTADGDPQEVAAIVQAHLIDQGYDGVTDSLTLNDPPLAGRAIGLNNYVEVTISRAVPMRFISTFWDMDVNVVARAVAGKVVVGEQCVVALDHSMDRALEFSGTANVNAGCGVASNSSSEEAIYIGGSANLTADPAQAFGDIAVSGSGTLTTASPIQSFAQRVDDPYGPDGSNLQVPAGSTCDYTGDSRVNDNETLSPGRYCGDIIIQGSNVILDPGTYIIDGGDLSTNGGADFSGEGVTFIFTGNSPSDVGGVSMNGGTVADLSAPTSGDYKGILFFQDPIATDMGTTSAFRGGANLTLDGVLYFPNSEIVFNGGSSFEPSCILLVGKKVNFSGNSVIQNDEATCTSLDLQTIAQERVQLVE